MDLGEFFIQCRNQNCFDLGQVQTIILEPNGKFSILFLASNRPITPSDLNLNPPSEHLLANVIMEGKIMKENLKNIGRDETWLRKALEAYNYPDLKEIFLATCNTKGELAVYKKIEQEKKEDLLL